jgi:hypothetical protein
MKPGLTNIATGFLTGFSWSAYWMQISLSWTESNREGEGCMYYLITQNIDNDYKNFLINNLIINI